jgi:multidrug efflux pump subunit AcrA (membrane-fusion protein)
VPKLPRRFLFVLLAAALPCACRQDPTTPTAGGENHAPPKTNRIAVPEAVRKNLGIGFAKVERRAVAATMRLPGAFELLPHGRTELRTPLPGRITVLVRPLQPVQPGDVLFTLDSPEWRRQQRELGELESGLVVIETNLRAMTPLLAACEQHEASLHNARTTLQQHLDHLTGTQQQVGGQAQRLAEVRVELAQTGAQVAEASEKHTQTQTRITELEANLQAQRERLQLALEAAAATVGVPSEQLRGGDGQPGWRTLAKIEVRATTGGIVETIPLATGAFVDAHSLVLTTIDPSAVRCRARALQSDLGRLRDGLPTRITAPGNDPAASVPATLQLGTAGDPLQRTIDVFATPTASAPFVRPGTTAYVEITTLGGPEPTLAIPRSAVLQDGLSRVLFRRDPNDPDQVIRLDADLGTDDGRWIEVKSGLKDGDEVVTTGAYELVLASSGQATKGGHFHADGTWHEDHE